MYPKILVASICLGGGENLVSSLELVPDTKARQNKKQETTATSKKKTPGGDSWCSWGSSYSSGGWCFKSAGDDAESSEGSDAKDTPEEDTEQEPESSEYEYVELEFESAEYRQMVWKSGLPTEIKRRKNEEPAEISCAEDPEDVGYDLILPYDGTSPAYTGHVETICSQTWGQATRLASSNVQRDRHLAVFPRSPVPKSLDPLACVEKYKNFLWNTYRAQVFPGRISETEARLLLMKERKNIDILMLVEDPQIEEGYLTGMFPIWKKWIGDRSCSYREKLMRMPEEILWEWLQTGHQKWRYQCKRLKELHTLKVQFTRFPHYMKAWLVEAILVPLGGMNLHYSPWDQWIMFEQLDAKLQRGLQLRSHRHVWRNHVADVVLDTSIPSKTSTTITRQAGLEFSEGTLSAHRDKLQRERALLGTTAPSGGDQCIFTERDEALESSLGNREKMLQEHQIKLVEKQTCGIDAAKTFDEAAHSGDIAMLEFFLDHQNIVRTAALREYYFEGCRHEMKSIMATCADHMPALQRRADALEEKDACPVTIVENPYIDRTQISSWMTPLERELSGWDVKPQRSFRLCLLALSNFHLKRIISRIPAEVHREIALVGLRRRTLWPTDDPSMEVCRQVEYILQAAGDPIPFHHETYPETALVAIAAEMSGKPPVSEYEGVPQELVNEYEASVLTAFGLEARYRPSSYSAARYEGEATLEGLINHIWVPDVKGHHIFKQAQDRPWRHKFYLPRIEKFASSDQRVKQADEKWMESEYVKKNCDSGKTEDLATKEYVALKVSELKEKLATGTEDPLKLAEDRAVDEAKLWSWMTPFDIDLSGLRFVDIPGGIREKLLALPGYRLARIFAQAQASIASDGPRGESTPLPAQMSLARKHAVDFIVAAAGGRAFHAAANSSEV